MFVNGFALIKLLICFKSLFTLSLSPVLVKAKHVYFHY